MADYYIDPTAPAGGSGSSVSPFNTIEALPTRGANDNVYFKRGTTTVGQLTHTPANATSTLLSAPVLYGAYGEGPEPILRSDQYVVDISQPGAVVQDLQLGPVNSFSSGGLRALNCGQVRAQRLITEDRCDYGVRIDNTTGGMFSKLEALNNEIQGTHSNSGILVVYGSSVGGVFEDVKLNGNTVQRPGRYASGGTPMGIRVLSRTTPATSGSGTVDLDLFLRGLECNHNTVSDTAGYGIALAQVSSGGTATLQNMALNNTLRRIGNGEFDAHALWAGSVRDMVLGWNDIDTTTMFQGSEFGTGVGIFVDSAVLGNEFDGAKRVRVISNRVRNTGQLATGSLGSLEVAGAGILVFLSQSVEVINNDVADCHNGVGVLGWFGNGLKSDTVTLRGNKVRRSVRDGISVIKASNAVTLQENFVSGSGLADYYVENAGSYAVTSYTEARNNAQGLAATAYQGGSEPTSSATPRGQRTPVAGNLTIAGDIRV